MGDVEVAGEYYSFWILSIHYSTSSSFTFRTRHGGVLVMEPPSRNSTCAYFFALAFAAHFILLAHAATLTVVAAGGYGRGGKRRSKGNVISTCNDRCMPA